MTYAQRRFLQTQPGRIHPSAHASRERYSASHQALLHLYAPRSIAEGQRRQPHGLCEHPDVLGRGRSPAGFSVQNSANLSSAHSISTGGRSSPRRKQRAKRRQTSLARPQGTFWERRPRRTTTTRSSPSTRYKDRLLSSHHYKVIEAIMSIFKLQGPGVEV